MATKATLNIRLVGEFQPDRPSHRATVEALQHAAEYLEATIDAKWVPTRSLQSAGWEKLLDGTDGLWLAPGAPYESQVGAHRSIGFAREHNVPFFGT